MLSIFSCNSDDFFDIDYYDILPGDIMFKDASSIEAGLTGVYDTFYGNWKWSPTYMIQNITTMDILAGGWDAAFSTHDWNAGTRQFRTLWNNYYKGVSTANFFLEGAEETDASLFNNGEKGKKQTIAQARAIRAMNYLQLVQGWGRVPMVMTGENGSNTPEKARPENDEECWKLIEEDLTYAVDNLDFDPIGGQYGRITKGTALGYRAEAYMCQKKYDLAKKDYEAIIASGKYKLMPCFSYLFDTDKGWSSETCGQFLCTATSARTCTHSAVAEKTHIRCPSTSLQASSSVVGVPHTLVGKPMSHTNRETSVVSVRWLAGVTPTRSPATGSDSTRMARQTRNITTQRSVASICQMSSASSTGECTPSVMKP